jgi:cytochrome c-type biogenesis protein CcmH
MAEAKNENTKAAGGSKAGFVALGLALVLAVISIGYNLAQAGDDTDRTPLSQSPQTLEELRDLAEARGDDALLWQELGNAHFQRAQFAEAADAYDRAAALDPSEAVLWSALGEARVMASERDPMPPAAREAFRKAIELDPKDPRARYFLGVEKDLAKDHEGAIADWLALLADTPRGAPWEADLIRTIEQVGAINAIDVTARLEATKAGRPAAQAMAGPALSGPTQEQIAAAGSIPPSEQRAMAEGMVGRLEQRLKDDPSDLDRWVMLMRSRMTLDQPERAKAALDAAIAANPGAAPGLRAEAQKLGIR